MADVRAEILAASRSRTGWLEGSVQAPESQPFVSKVKSSFEEKNINQDNKLASNASKSEAVRRLGSKVSSIATLFQSFSPHRSESPKSCDAPVVNKVGVSANVQKVGMNEKENKLNTDPEVKPVDSESLHKRISNARAIFEQLGEKGKECSKLSEHSRNSYQERDRIPSVSSQYSSQSSPDEEPYSMPFCQKSSTHKSPAHTIEEKGHTEKSRPDDLPSVQNIRECQNFLPPESTRRYAQNSPIYEEIPGIAGDKSESLSQTSKSHGHYEAITKSEGDKNANTTNSYIEPLVQPNSNTSNQNMDSSFPIYAQVIKKRSKHSANVSNPEQGHGTSVEDSKSNKFSSGK